MWFLGRGVGRGGQHLAENCSSFVQRGGEAWEESSLLNLSTQTKNCALAVCWARRSKRASGVIVVLLSFLGKPIHVANDSSL